MIVKIVLIQKNPGNSNSEGKRKTVRVIRVDCKIQFAMLKIYIYWFFGTKEYCDVQISFIRNGNMVSFFFMIKRDLLFAPIKIKLLLVLASVSFSVRIQQEELMGWHPSGVKNLQNSSCQGKFQWWTFDRAESEI